MPRYELVEGSSSKFWEIELEGTSFTTKYGRIGTDGQATLKSFKSEADAKKQHDKIVAEKTSKGYALVGESRATAATPRPPKKGAAENPELEKAIVEAPDSPDAYLVYGDWLAEQGDPLGELIAVQGALAKSPGDAALAKRAVEILEANEEKWLGEKLDELKTNDELKYTWRYGFFETITMGGDEGSETGDGAPYVEALLKNRLSRFLRELQIGVFGADEGNPEYQTIVNRIAKLGLPKTLRRLAIDVQDFQISWTDLGDLSKAYPAMDHIEELRLAIGNMKLGAAMPPQLKKLEIVTGGLTKANLKSVLNTKWTKLESLALYFGDPSYNADCEVEDLESLFEAKNLGTVKHLGLCNAPFADAIVSRLVGSKILPRLKTLSLAKGTLGDEGAAVILENAAAFAHLEKIDVSQNYIGGDVQDRLLKQFGVEKIDITEQGDEADPDDRYVQVAE